jgi:hypothetical protein
MPMSTSDAPVMQRVLGVVSSPPALRPSVLDFSELVVMPDPPWATTRAEPFSSGLLTAKGGGGILALKGSAARCLRRRQRFGDLNRRERALGSRRRPQ